MNPLRHGLRARNAILPHESPAEFNQLCEALEAEWSPQSRTEQFYLEQMAVSQWKLSRMEAAERDVYEQTIAAKEQVPLLDRLWQAQGRMERSYARAQRELQRLQKARRDEPQQVEDPVPPSHAGPISSVPPDSRIARATLAVVPASANSDAAS